MSDNEAVVLFSGGTDSTLVAALAADEFERVHLVTCRRFGFRNINNASVNAGMLKDRFGSGKYYEETLNIDGLFKYISYENYFKNLYRFGFSLLSTCGLCKLAMHMRSIDYCLHNGICTVLDGANKGMSLFPAQMEPVLEMLRAMYRKFGIEFSSPVFDMEAPEQKDFIEKSNLHFLKKQERMRSEENERIALTSHPGSRTQQRKTSNNIDRGPTPGEQLNRMGLAPSPDVKGTVYDRERQAGCFQFIVFNIWAIRYFNAPDNYDKYVAETTRFFKYKIDRATEIVEKRVTGKKYEKLFG